MQQIEKKYFVSLDSGLDADSADFAVGENQWVNMENCRTLTTDNGVTMTVESIGGTLMIDDPQPSVNYKYHGGAEDNERNRIVYILFNLTGTEHKIMCYDVGADTIYTVLKSSQTTDGLNFNKYSFVHSARIVNGMFYWVDDVNHPRRINIDAGINMNHPGTYPDVEPYTSPLDENIITIIRKPPNLCLSAQKVIQTSPAVPANLIQLFAGKFAAYYKFRDNEESVLSGYSPLINYNFKTDEYNAIDVSLQLGDIIPQDVMEVRFAVQYGNDPDFFVIKIWDRDNPDDEAEINAHNAGTTPLTFRFYNDQTGIPLSTDFSTKPFDSVPINSKTLEVAKNRLYLANNIEGYSTPLKTSLTAQFSSQSIGTTLQASVFKLTWNGGGSNKYVIHIPSITGGNPAGYYRVSADDNVPPSDPTAQAALTFISSGTTEVFKYYVPGWPIDPIDSFTFQNYIQITGVSNPLINQLAYKSGASYKIGVVFYDRWMRKCGVVINGITYIVPERAYSITSYVTSLDWSLSNATMLDEIPDWAYYYSIVRTKALTASFFIQARSKTNSVSMSYANKNTDTGEYIFGISSYSTNLVGVAVNISNIESAGMGYVFTEGDIIKICLSTSSSPVRLRIIGQQGSWVIAELSNLGALSLSTDALFEIYTPYTPSLNEPYFEIGQIFPINNPATTNRSYSVFSGSIRGDITLLSRGQSPNDYITENMSPNDTKYKEWLTDAGRPNFIDRIGQKEKPTNISWSNVFILGSRINGLSSFDPLDEKSLPTECGAIRKLQLTSKVQNEQGVVMLAICEKETASMYIGEVQTYQSNSSSSLVLSEQVIGTVNILKGNYGTLNPESVVEYRGNVYWVDIKNGRVIQYAENGLFPISNYKMTRFWKLFSDMFMSKTKEEIESFGSWPNIFTSVDRHHNELLISIPKLSATPPNGYLPDYPAMIYPFDIWDANAKTIVYKIDIGRGNPHWQGAYTFYAEGFLTLGNRLFSFNSGHLYLHNQTNNYNQFYGVQYDSRIMFVSNQNPNIPKSYNSISIEGNMKPSLTYFYIKNPFLQVSDLVDYDYNDLEGFLYATLYRNKIIPTANGFTTNGLLTGDKMRGYAMYVMLEFEARDSSPLELRFVNLKYTISRGHKTL